MAEKLSITIALEGGKQIEQQLEGIGQAGQKAFEDIQKAAEQAGGFKNLKPEEVTQKLKDMGVTGADALNKISGAVAEATRLERIVGVVQAAEKGFAGLSAAAVGFARALGPIAGAAAVAGAALVKMASDAAGAINKIDQAAIKAGMSIKEFDQLRQGFEAAGLSAKGVASAMSGIAEAAQKAKLADVAKDLEQAKKGISGQQLVPLEGFGMVTESFRRLVTTAREFGPAADGARKALESIGVTVAPNVNKSLSEMIRLWGDTSVGTAAFVEQLRTMPDSANRSALAVDGFKDAGAELVQALRSGKITDDQFKERLGAISPAATKAANDLEGSANRMGTAIERLKTTGDLSQLGIIFQELGTQAGAAFSLLTTAAGTALSAIGTGFEILGAKLGEFWRSIGGGVWQVFSSAGTEAINTISSAIDGLITKVGELIRKLAEAASNTLKTGTPGGGGTAPIPGNAAGGLIGGRGSGTSDSNLAWLSRGEYVMPASAVRQPGVRAFLEMLRRSGGIPGYAAGGQVGGTASGMVGFLDRIRDMVVNVYPPVRAVVFEVKDKLIEMVKDLHGSLTSIVRAIEAQMRWLQGVAGNARGGMIGGRGTGTSDSNLAWVSRGEHIMPARAVRQPGVLAFLEALRRSGGNLGHLLDGMGRFATGGLVPRFAAVGGGMGHHLGTVDLRTDHGVVRLMAGASAVEQLSRLAVTKRMTSTGRKPGFIG